jgi:hypothetical protein
MDALHFWPDILRNRYRHGMMQRYVPFQLAQWMSALQADDRVPDLFCGSGGTFTSLRSAIRFLRSQAHPDSFISRRALILLSRKITKPTGSFRLDRRESASL